MMYRDITVLIVEDDAVVGNALDTMLTRKRFQTLRAPDQMTAFELLGKADMLLVDLKLPNGDGRMVLEQWNKRDKLGPSIVVSGTFGGEEEQRLLDAAWYVFKKPFLMGSLLTVIERMAVVIRGMRCCEEVTKLKKRMNLMWIAIAALGGTQIFLPLIEALIKSLGGG